MVATRRRLHFAVIDSTNAEALRLAEQGECGPLWVDAETQESGRGRSGRAWQSQPGNLMTSVLLTTDAPREALAQLSLVAGVAMIEAVRNCAQGKTDADGLALKWPNDLLRDGKKAGGILVESSTQGQQTTVVVGFGLNTCTAPSLPGVATADLSDLLSEADGLSHVRDALADGMEKWLAIWANGTGFQEVRTAWMCNGPASGQSIEVRQGAKSKRGRYAGLDATGALCLETPDGTQELITVGDVDYGPA